jgi:hypothetical protein
MEPKLLSEREAAILFGGLPVDHILLALRERGLIAPEPVDPLLEEADSMVFYHTIWDTLHDKEAAHDLALAALKRGMELARPTLTREMVASAYRSAWGYYASNEDAITAIHAALVERMTQGG